MALLLPFVAPAPSPPPHPHCTRSYSSPFSSPSSCVRGKNARRIATPARAFFNPMEDPIMKEGLKEPVAFLGGMFAGLLRLDLNEEPLKDWINKTVEAAGITVEEINSDETEKNEAFSQPIEIE